MIDHAHQWIRGACRSCHADRCADRNRPGFRCVLADAHPTPHRYADGTTEPRTDHEH